MEVYKFYEIQHYMTLTRHVYSPHIDVASLKWWKTLSSENAGNNQHSHDRRRPLFQRKDNREKDEARLKNACPKGDAD